MVWRFQGRHGARLSLLAAVATALCAAVPASTTCSGLLAARSSPTGLLSLEASRVVTARQAELAVMDLLRSRYFVGATTITVAGRGGESLVVAAAFPQGHRAVVRVPRGDHWDRVLKAYGRELAFVRRAVEVDAVGAAHLCLPRRLHIDGPTGLPMLFVDYATDGSFDRHLAHWGPGRARDHPEEVLALWRQMALGVRALHRAGIVHRDVKPANFLVTGGRLQLSDLGLATPVGRQVFGFEGLLTGTLSHMSDNQLGRGNAGFVDDLYALKITFYETLVGRTVWELDPREPANHVVLRRIDEFGTYPMFAGLPDEVTATVPASLLAIAQREFPSADALLDALENR